MALPMKPAPPVTSSRPGDDGDGADGYYDGSNTTGFVSPAGDAIEGPIDLSHILDLRRPHRYPVRVSGDALRERGILPGDPFVSIDREGVGALVRIGVERGRKTRKGLKVGICGEHGGDPASVAFCHEIALDYVSCSPFRVPIARLAAAQAALGTKAAGEA